MSFKRKNEDQKSLTKPINSMVSGKGKPSRASTSREKVTERTNFRPTMGPRNKSINSDGLPVMIGKLQKSTLEVLPPSKKKVDLRMQKSLTRSKSTSRYMTRLQDDYKTSPFITANP